MIIDLLNDEDLDAYIEAFPPPQWIEGVMMTQFIDFRPMLHELRDGKIVTTKRKLMEYRKRAEKITK